MTSRIKGNTGSQGRVVEVCSMESKKDDGPEKARFLVVRGEIYKRYTAQQKIPCGERRNLQAVHRPPHSHGQIDEEADCGLYW